MSDASEHLAPVSYLPWATPDGDRGAGSTDRAARETDRSEPIERAERSEPAEQHLQGSDPDQSGAAGRSLRSVGSSRSKNSRSFGRADRSSRSTVTVETDGDDGGDVRLETGPERDDRIDRIIVARLRRSALSVAEVRSTLVEHGLDAAEIEEWIERYERFGYLDDARLAEQLVHVNAGRRGKGSGAILQELSRRGVGAEAARAAIEGLDPDTEFENALAVAERRARQLRGLERHVAERRLSAFLQRRGYSGEVVRQVVTQALEAEGS